MGRPGEDKFTDIIKHKLESYEPAYNPNAWSNFSARLGSTPPAAGVFKYWFWGLLTGLFLTTSISYLWIDNYNEDENIKLLKNEIALLRKEVNSLNTNNPNTSTGKLNLANNIIHSKPNKQQSTYQSTLKQQYIFIDHETTQLTAANVSNHTNIDDRNHLKYMPSIYAYTVNNYVLNKDSLKKVTLNSKPTNKQKKKSNIHLKWPSFRTYPNDNMYKTFTGPDRIFASANVIKEFTHKNKAVLSNGFGIGLSGEISNRLTISGGISLNNTAWSDKTTLSHEITVYTDTIHKYNVIDTIISSYSKWQYLQLPISVHYALYKTNKSTIELSGGLNSYIYLDEQYKTALTKLNTPPILSEKKYGQFENIHLASKLNIGLNYTYKVNNRWNFHLQPYYTLPLQKVSALKISEKSFGLNFNVSYRFRKPD